MKRITIVSNSLKTLQRAELTSSSEKYEWDLAQSLSVYAEVQILSFAAKNDLHECFGKVRLERIEKRILKSLRLFQNAGVVIFFGYDLKNVLFMLSLRWFSAQKVIPFIFDTHKPAISAFKPIKRLAAEIYFLVGRFLLRYFDGAILFQDEAAALLRIKKPYHVSKPGIVPGTVNPEQHTKEHFNVVFAGSLTKLNGIDIFLAAARKLASHQLHFCVYGPGPMIDQVRQAEGKGIVTYGGVLPDEALKKVYSEADILVNLRDPDDEAMKYAFPSKLIEIMDTAVPVISTKIIDDSRFQSAVYVIDQLTPDSLSAAIEDVQQNYTSYQEKAMYAKKYVEEEFSFDTLGKAMWQYLESLDRS